MRGMKDSNYSWLGVIPQEQEIKRVKYVFDRKNEKAKQEKPSILSLARSGVKIRDISNNEGQIAESYYNYNPVEIDDLLINPMDLYSGANCSISHVEGVISPAYINLRTKVGYNPRYYDYYFKIQYWSMAFFSHGKGVSFENRWTLNTETLMNYPVICPPHDVQIKIANYLDDKCKKINKMIAKEQEEIEKVQEYKQSIITETVTKGIYDTEKYKKSEIEWIKEIPEKWKVRKLKYLFKFVKGLPITKDDLKESGVPVISYGQIHSKLNDGVNIRPELIRYVDKNYIKTNMNSLVKENDFIFADTSEDLEGCGNCVFIDDDYDYLFAGYHTIIFDNKSKENNKYFAYLFKTNLWRSQIRLRVSGIKLFSITQKILKEITLIIPTRNEQEKIIELLDARCSKIEILINDKKNIIEKLQEYKKSLIYECVTGKKEIR